MKNTPKKITLASVAEQLKTFATKEDLKAFATKDDLNKAVDRITGHMDGLWGESKRLDEVVLMQGQRVTDQFERLNDHERRITALEAHTH